MSVAAAVRALIAMRTLAVRPRDLFARMVCFPKGEAVSLWAEWVHRDARVAYRKRVMQVHPDRGGDAELFCKVQLAWQYLQRDDLGGLVWDALQDHARRVAARKVSHSFRGVLETDRDPAFLKGV